MLDRDTGAKFDHDPNLDRPFNPTTWQSLQKYKASDEFRYHYDGNLALAGDLDRLSDIGRRKAIWSRAFVDRLFSIDSVATANRLLEPWMKWGEVHSQIWSKYWNGEGEDTNARYNATQAEFDAVEIPPAIREYQDDLSDDELRSLAHWEIFKLARDIRELIDLFEGVTRPVSLDTIFRAQRIMNQPIEPTGGLKPDIVNKPSLRRIEHDGKHFIAFDFEGMPADTVFEDPSSDAEWERWNQLQLGTHIKYLREDHQAKQKTLESGTVHGFLLLGAGDAMLFGPSVANIGIIAVNDRTRFYQCPLVSEIRLGSEEFTPEELTRVEQPKPVDVVVMRPSAGEVTKQTFGSMEEATEAVGKQIVQEFGEQG